MTLFSFSLPFSAAWVRSLGSGAAGVVLAASALAQSPAPAALASAAAPAPAGVVAAGNAKAGQGIAQNGLPPGVAACATCHGAQGEGSAAFPPLAGNGATYLLEQLNHFANNSREQAIMHPIAKGLSAQQRADVAAFYAGQRRLQQPIKARMEPARPADAGAWLAQRGRWSDGIPACAQCHGPDGLGVGEHFPALAGLSAAYMQEQISAWQAGKRPPGPLQLMSSVAQKLTPDDITAVAAHYARLHGGGTAAGKTAATAATASTASTAATTSTATVAVPASSPGAAAPAPPRAATSMQGKP